MFLWRDKIVQIYNINNKKKRDIFISYCDYPTSKNKFNLNYLIKTGNHIIGEDFLVY